MKKILATLVLAMVLIMGFTAPMQAAVIEDWPCFEARGGLAKVWLTINTNNLKTDKFVFENNTDDTLYFFIYNPSTRTIINNWSAVSYPHTTQTLYWQVNYQRNNTDPDSYPIRMSPNTNFSFGTGSPLDNGIS